jgi:hypothetical protein
MAHHGHLVVFMSSLILSLALGSGKRASGAELWHVPSHLVGGWGLCTFSIPAGCCV